MKFKIIWWYLFNKERFRNYIILRWLKKAKKFYIEKKVDGMCWALMTTVPKKHLKLRIGSIVDVIPQYSPEYFNTRVIEEGSDEGYWWPVKDRESRIKAFDKLIDDYQSLVK